MKILFTKEEAAALSKMADDIEFPLKRLTRIKPEYGAHMELDIKADQVIANANETVKLLSKISKEKKRKRGTELLTKLSQMFPKGFIR